MRHSKVCAPVANKHTKFYFCHLLTLIDMESDGFETNCINYRNEYEGQSSLEPIIIINKERKKGVLKRMCQLHSSFLLLLGFVHRYNVLLVDQRPVSIPERT